MLVRFIIACMAVVAFSLLYTPFSAVYRGVADSRSAVIAFRDVPVDSDTDMAENAAALNAIETAAGVEDTPARPEDDAVFHRFFPNEAPAAL